MVTIKVQDVGPPPDAYCHCDIVHEISLVAYEVPRRPFTGFSWSFGDDQLMGRTGIRTIKHKKGPILLSKNRAINLATTYSRGT